MLGRTKSLVHVACDGWVGEQTSLVTLGKKHSRPKARKKNRAGDEKAISLHLRSSSSVIFFCGRLKDYNISDFLRHLSLEVFNNGRSISSRSYQPTFLSALLPGFHTHLSVPIAFFAKHLQESNDHIKTAKLRTDASAKTWLVKVDGLKFTDGWKDFADGHDLQIGDIIIFRHEGEMVFHVTAFRPSCCDIQYTSASSHNINDDSHDQTTNNTGHIASGSRMN